MDGSSAPFVYLIRSAGIFQQREERQMLRIRRKIEVIDGDRSISIEPSRDFRVSYAVDFDHPAIRRQELDLGPLSPERFERDISAARTFGFLREVHALWDAGFARGGSLDNTVVLDHEKVVNPEGLRWPDEFVRHKVLDLCGDLALLGLPCAAACASSAAATRCTSGSCRRSSPTPTRGRSGARSRRAARAGALVRRRSHLIARLRGDPPNARGARRAPCARRRRRTRCPCPPTRSRLRGSRPRARGNTAQCRLPADGTAPRAGCVAAAAPRSGQEAAGAQRRRRPFEARAPGDSIATCTRSVRRG